MRLLTLVFLSVLLLGCVRTPTQVTQTVDDRPRVAFDTAALAQKASAYQVRIDGVMYGSIQRYQHDKNTLPLLPGKHLIEVLLDGDVIFVKEVFLGEHSTRTIKVVHYD